MIVHYLRDVFAPGWTLGVLSVEYDGDLAYGLDGWRAANPRGPLPLGYIVEDRDRGLDSRDPATLAAKVQGKTAIPTGEYVVKTTWSNRFQRPMPLLHDVPGFRGIRVHTGNNADHTEGCMLPALARDVAAGTTSKSAPLCAWLYARIAECEARGEAVRWRVARDIPAWAAFTGPG